MKQDIPEMLRRLRVPASPNLDERVYGEIAKTAPRSNPELTLGQIFSLFLKQKSIRYTLATALGLALMAISVLNHSTTPAFAMEQAIDALKKYRAVHITGYVTTTNGTTPIDAWARSDASGDRLETGLAKGYVTVWTRDNKTYVYNPAHNTVLVEPGITFGLNPWLGPTLLTQLSKMKDYKAFEGEDPATGQKRIIVTASIWSSSGPLSFLVEFDARTKLLVSSKTWNNLKQEGTPYCSFEKIVYFEDLPDSTFHFQPPAGATFTDMPLWVPEANLSLLSDPGSGISAEGMTQEQACQKILDQLWTAWRQNDFARVRQLFPISASWPDELLHDLREEDKVVKVLKIGGIEKTGTSKLGPITLVPTWNLNQDGTTEKIWMIIQFRETDQGTSCVVYGPHGYALNVKE